MLGRFNGFLKSVILRVSEARDLGEFDRFAFYDHMKSLTAAPPDVLRVDEKNLREYAIPNVCGVIITTNHKTDGIYLPADDRRHFVAWSDLDKSALRRRLLDRALAMVRAAAAAMSSPTILRNLDLTGFDPKAPPPQTDAFFEIVNASRAPEDAELADALDALSWPNAVTIDAIKQGASAEFRLWLDDRKNRKAIAYRLETNGYTLVRNPHQKRGAVEGRRQKHGDLCER